MSNSDVVAGPRSDAQRLFEQHAPSLQRYLARLCGDTELAADAVQETFVRFLARGAGAAPPRAWLFRVGANLVREWSRTRVKRGRLLASSPAHTGVGDAPRAPDADVELRALAMRVRAALDRLPERDRKLLLMREEGFTHREMAEAVGTTTKSVGTLIARALERLASELPLREGGIP